MALSVALGAQPRGHSQERRASCPAEREAEAAGAQPPRRRPPAATVAAGSGRPAPRQEPLPYTFDNFVVGACNALAREAALAISEASSQELSQVFLVSATGLGKTHLAKATATAAQKVQATQAAGGGTAFRSDGRAHPAVVYNSCEGFTNEFLSSVRNDRMSAFKKKYRGGRVLVIEDVQFLSGKDSTQLEFFHTVQHVLGVGGRVLLTADRMPAEIRDLDDRVRSQLSSSFIAELEPPDAAVRRQILCSRAARGGVSLPQHCLDLLVETVTGSVRDIEAVLVQLVATASLLKQPIDLELTRSAVEKRLGDAFRTPRRPAPELVIEVVAGFFQTNRDALSVRSRRREVLRPRQLAMYLCRRYTDASMAEIGRALGRDHPAVKNAIEKIEREVLSRAPTRYEVEALSRRLDEVLLRGDVPGTRRP